MDEQLHLVDLWVWLLIHAIISCTMSMIKALKVLNSYHILTLFLLNLDSEIKIMSEIAQCTTGCSFISVIYIYHDDVMTLTHFPHHWPSVLGIHRLPRDSQRKGPMLHRFNCCFIVSRNSRMVGDISLWRPCDVTVMTMVNPSILTPVRHPCIPFPVFSSSSW